MQARANCNDGWLMLKL